MTYIFLNFLIFLGHVVCLPGFQIITNLKVISNTFIEKESLYKWTHTVQTCVQGSILIALFFG